MSIRNFLLAALTVCAPASAVTTYNFDFTNSSGSFSSLSAYSGSLTVTATAFSTSNASSSFSAATIGQYSGAGLGICNSSTESGSNCTSPEHQIDNNGRYEFMLFKFSTPVDLSSITIKNFNTSGSLDRDLTYYKSSSAASSITLGTLNSLGNGFGIATSVNCANGCTGSTSVDALSGTGVTYLLVGAAGPGGDSYKDYFKITGLSVTTADVVSDGAVPEPSTISTALIALGGFGFMAYRRRNQCVKS